MGLTIGYPQRWVDGAGRMAAVQATEVLRERELVKPDTAEDLVMGVTIDGPDSRDLDDAIWLEEHDEHTLLRVCIADVTHAVALGTPLDAEARARGFTRYYATGNDPMLPRALAEGSLSLLPGEPRQVSCIEMTLDDHLHVTKVAIRQAVLRSAAKLTYAQVAATVEGKSAEEEPPFAEMLRALANLSVRLLELRRSRGELAIYDLLHGWATTEEGQIRRLSINEANIGYIVVQEMMILTNRSVAGYLIRADVPTLYRNHRARVAAPERTDLAESLSEAAAHPAYFDLATLQNRLQLLLNRARYEAVATGHYGLNLPAYLHFTSPIRRYSDVVNARVLHAHLRGEPPPYTVDELSTIGGELNQLTDEEIELEHERYRRRKAREIEVNLTREAEHLALLTDKDAYRTLRQAGLAPEAPDALRRAVAMRIERGTISVKEVFCILFECPASGAWEELRRAALEWICQQPAHAVSILSMGGALRGWQAPQFDFAVAAGGFVCSAVLVTEGSTFEGARGYSSTKRAAQQFAAIDLCHRILGVETPAGIRPSPDSGIGSEPNWLADEGTELVHGSHSPRAAQEIETDLAREAERLALQNDREAYRTLQQAGTASKPPEVLRRAVGMRFERGTISLKEVFGLLFECPASGAWQDLKRTGLTWICQQPAHAVSILSMGAALRGWQTPHFDFEESGCGFACSAGTVTEDSTFEGARGYGTTKRAAQQFAALDLCHRILGLEPPAGVPPADDSAQGEPTPKLGQASAAPPVRDASTICREKVVQDRLRAGDYVSAVYMLCTQLKCKRPRFLFQIGKAADGASHRCRAVLQWEGETIEGQGTGMNSAAAKQGASENLLASWRSRFETAE